MVNCYIRLFVASWAIKYAVPGITYALGYVVWNTGGYYAGNSWHGEKLLRVSKIVKLIGMVSLYFS